MKMLLLILSLPTENATTRMRAWRALKASGAAVLRDGVYLMPDIAYSRSTLSAISSDVIGGGGSSYVLEAEPTDDTDFSPMFDRGEEYAALMAEVGQARALLSDATVHDVLKQARRLRKSYAALGEIDFYPGEARRQIDQALSELELACARALAPDEPHAIDQPVGRRHIADYQGRVWATRKRPWVDRLACAWLIRRFIDPKAEIRWLASPLDCPQDVLGFDFDGATFSHVGSRVSFEVMLASFDLDQPGLQRLGQLVHYLDVGGVQPPEAAGVESILGGLRAAMQDDDQLLQAASAVFDGLLLSFHGDAPASQSTERSK